MLHVTPELKFETTRSGGAGGQNVNKVETAVIAYFNVRASALLTEAQKSLVLQKLTNRITKEGVLVVKAQTHRTQLENKSDATEKINALLTQAVQRKNARIATKPSRAAAAARVEGKKRAGEQKQARRKWRPGTF